MSDASGQTSPGSIPADAPLYLPVLLGTVRKGNATSRLAAFVRERIGEMPGVETRVFDPAHLPFGNLEAREWEMDPRPAEVDAFVREMDRADGFVIVTPEYNWGIPGTLKNLLDHLVDEWERKPFGAVAGGGSSGGLRAIDHLRQVIAGINGVAVPAHVGVQHVNKVFAGDGVEDEAAWTRRVNRFLEEVAWYARALQAARRPAAAAGEAAETASPA